MARRLSPPKSPTGRRQNAPSHDGAPPPQGTPTVVGIGASAGGLEAFTAFLGALPAETGLSFVFVQHSTADRGARLAEVLARATPLPVRDVQSEATLETNHVYVIPGGQLASIRDGRLVVTPGKELHERTVDHLFSSLAEAQGHRAIGVVLSGTATDGTIGLRAIKENGGITFAQDGSAQHDGMPRSAISSGCVDFVLPPEKIAREIAALGPHLYEAAADGVETEGPGLFEEVLAIVREECGVDFAHYKSNTLHRRIRRRMAMHRLASPKQYAQFLKANPKEAELLYQDILIGVTSFFRDPEAFESLRESVFPALFADRSRHDPVRVWVVGCATGEEAYSLAIALKEYQAEINSQVSLTIYATDLNNAAIEKARIGLYPKSITADVSAERLRRYFVEADGGYRVAKAIREICIFARQNMLTDPPFSRMDLISCRNVLIYVEPSVQKKLLPILNYALKPRGHLFLGPSESLGANRDLFDVADARHKIFRKKPVAVIPRAAVPLVPPPNATRTAEGRPQRWEGPRGEIRPETQKEADRVLLARYVPPGVLINGDMEILQFRGDIAPFLAPAPGKASFNLFKMAREGLLVPLRAVVQRAVKEEAGAQQDEVRVKIDGEFVAVRISVVPVPGSAAQRCFWVLFEPAVSPPAQLAVEGTRRSAARTRPDVRKLSQESHQIERLTQELVATREYLQSVIEQQEAANEELQSANEEVQSANEELQSINEELETSKEEIQSSNEELVTVNEELQNRNEELTRVNDDLNNLFSSVQMAMVMVGRDLCIRRFTPLAQKHLNLIAGDIGRPIGNIRLKFDVGDLPHILAEVIDAVLPREFELQDGEGHWFQLRIRPYKTLSNQIDGAVIVLVDIDTLKRSQEALSLQARLLEHTTDAVLVREPDGAIVYWNRAAEMLYGWTQDEVRGRTIQQVLGLAPGTLETIRASLRDRGMWAGEVEQRRRDGATVVVVATQVSFEDANRHLVLETHHDITERKRLEDLLQMRVQELAAADRSKNEFLAMLAHELRNPLAPLRNAVAILRAPARSADTDARTVALIERQVGTMARLVDDLLDAARLTQGKVDLQIEPVVLQKVIEAAVEDCRPDVDGRQHRLAVHLPADDVRMMADAMRLEQVFTNLLHNAVKYTPEGGTIELSLEVTEPADSAAQADAIVRVRDSGSGIGPELLPRVFDLFSQADQSLARSQGGLGIGLSIVKRIVELHGGRVEAHSAGRGAGSEFVVVLPVERSSKGTTDASLSMPAVAPRDPVLDACRVLVVDDNVDAAESLATLLGFAHCTVQTAYDGHGALEAAAAFHPDVVLLDIGMPDLDGYAVAEALRRDPALRSALIIAVSGYSRDEHRARSRAAGFDHHFSKPVDAARLLRLIQRHRHGDGVAELPGMWSPPPDERAAAESSQSLI